MKLIGAVNWDEVKETAKFYYTEPSYGAPEPSYGARNSWSSAGEYRSFNDEEGENLKDIYNSDWAAGEAASAVGSAARNLETVAESGLSSLVNKAIKLIN